MDRLAKAGTLFEHGYCQSPVCTPSRASFLTGRYPRTTGCRQNGQAIPEDEVLVTRLLAQAGYTCGLAGKLHLTPCHPSVAPITERRVQDGYAQFHWSHHPAEDWPTNEYSQWLRARGKKYEPLPHPESPYVKVGPADEDHHTTWCVEKAIQFIETGAAFANPWLFSVNFFDPHHDFDPPLSYLKRYIDRLADIPLPTFTLEELIHQPIFQQIDHYGAYGIQGYLPYADMTNMDHRLIRAAYWAMVDLIDVQVGRLLDVLESTGQADNTLVIFMSDHGEMLGDHGFYLKGPHFYDPAVRVPLIMSYPGYLGENKRVSTFVELIDLAPTLLEAVGLNPHPGMQGKSLWSLLTDDRSDGLHRDDVYCEYYNASHRHPGLAFATMLRTQQFKLVTYHNRTDEELFDLMQDPDELHNVADDPAYELTKGKLYKRLVDRMAETVDPLPVRQSMW